MRAHEVLADQQKIALNENEAARSLKVLALADQDHGPVPARNVMFSCAEPRRGGGLLRNFCGWICSGEYARYGDRHHGVVEVLCGLGQSSNSILAVKVGAMLLVPVFEQLKLGERGARMLGQPSSPTIDGHVSEISH